MICPVCGFVIIQPPCRVCWDRDDPEAPTIPGNAPGSKDAAGEPASAGAQAPPAAPPGSFKRPPRPLWPGPDPYPDDVQ